MGYFVGILAFIAGYSWLFLRAQNAIASGGYDTRVFYILNSVNLLLLVFAAFTLAWIVRDRFSQKSQGNS